MPTYRDLFDEYTVWVLREDIDMKISLCGLCGNSGMVDTRDSAIWNNKKVGIRDYCICPNGRHRKRKKI